MIANQRRGEIIHLQSSYVWPLLLIGLGGIWLLRTFDVIGNANMAILLRLWPLLLIIVGADILLRRDSRQLAQVVVFGGLVLLAALMVVGPTIGLWQVTAKTFEKVEPTADATSAVITVNLAEGRNTVSALTDSQTLFKANMTYLGDVAYDVYGTQTKVITLDNRASNLNFLDALSADLHLDVGLSSAIPMALNVANGSGSNILNLTDLKLTSLNITSGSGQVTANLAAPPDPYAAVISGGSGVQTINIPAHASLSLKATGGSGASRITVGNDVALTLKYNGGSGLLWVDIPDGAAVHIEARAGSGNVYVGGVPCATSATCQRNGGVWESPGFSSAARQINMNLSVGSGSITIR